MIVAAAMAAGLQEPEARATFASGWTAGTESPRVIPDNHQAMAAEGMADSNHLHPTLPASPHRLGQRRVLRSILTVSASALTTNADAGSYGRDTALPPT